jgi:carboxylesterase type B
LTKLQGYDCPNPASRPYRDFPGQTTQAPIILGPATLNESEDCLTLNIWTPRTKPNHGPSLYQKRKWKPNHPILKPVLVYIYGGQFTTGRTHSKLINGRYLSAAQDVVVVTVNYRINIFGFSGSPGYPQNAGLRDQRLAVEWIHANIAQFGGDPEKIVLFGQSAGAVGVDYLSYAYAQEPIVKGFILESGNSFSFPVHNQSTAVKNWYNVSTELGCGGSGDTIDCMRQQDWEDIKVAAAKVKSGDSGTVLRPIPAFYPTPDEEIVFSDYLGLLASGKYAKLVCTPTSPTFPNWPD